MNAVLRVLYRDIYFPQVAQVKTVLSPLLLKRVYFGSTMYQVFDFKHLPVFKFHPDPRASFLNLKSFIFLGPKNGPIGHSEEPVVLVQLHEVPEGGERLEPAPVLSLSRLVFTSPLMFSSSRFSR